MTHTSHKQSRLLPNHNLIRDGYKASVKPFTLHGSDNIRFLMLQLKGGRPQNEGMKTALLVPAARREPLGRFAAKTLALYANCFSINLDNVILGGTGVGW